MKFTEVEWRLMRAIWKRNPASARDVMENLDGEPEWAYSTVKTMLARLVEKGALSQRMRANTTLYTPLITHQQARRSAFRSLLDTAFEGAFGPLLHFMMTEKKLSAKDKQELRRMLNEDKEK